MSDTPFQLAIEFELLPDGGVKGTWQTPFVDPQTGERKLNTHTSIATIESYQQWAHDYIGRLARESYEASQR